MKPELLPKNCPRLETVSDKYNYYQYILGEPWEDPFVCITISFENEGCQFAMFGSTLGDESKQKFIRAMAADFYAHWIRFQVELEKSFPADERWKLETEGEALISFKQQMSRSMDAASFWLKAVQTPIGEHVNGTTLKAG